MVPDTASQNLSSAGEALTIKMFSTSDCFGAALLTVQNPTYPFMELRHTIRLIRELNAEITEIESEIDKIMEELHSPITTIPGIGARMGAMILAEIGDFSRFDSADKILAYAGLSPSTYQSGKLTNCYSHMEKRGSRYLRFAIFNATKYVCLWDSSFSIYLAKKRAEGKHYNVAISHAAKKLVRLIYALEKSGRPYKAVA